MSLLDATFACAKCGSTYPAGNVHHCATANLPSQVSPGFTCPACGCWHNGVHVCGLPGVPIAPVIAPQQAGTVTLVSRAELDALRAEVERLSARVAELERAAPRDILPPPYGPPGMVAGP